MTDKRWWSCIKQAGGVGRTSSLPTLVDSDGNECSSNAEKAECLGRYFSSKCSLGTDDFNGDLPPTRQRTKDSFSFIHFRRSTVKRELRKLNPEKATGPDDIPARVLKMCADELSLPLSRLFALCFRTGTQPALWKTARIVPVHKKKSRSTPSNYRPVSLLSIVSKVLESIINSSVMNFLEKRNVLSPHQFGFRRGLGTADLLTQLQHNWSTTVNEHGTVHALAIDIAGAFDKVSHPGVLHKIQACGLQGPILAWLKDYLKDRFLKVAVSGCESSPFPVCAGVPQGSILGPTLFLLYVNDCDDYLPQDCGSRLAVYADDTTLYKCIRATADLVTSSTQLQLAADSIARWGAIWKIKFEPTKSQALTISFRRPPTVLPPIIFNGVAVAEETEVKLLGVTFDNGLSFRHHLRNVASKANSRIHFLRKVSPLLDAKGRLTVYKGFVRPTMEYCSLTWMGASAASLSQLDRVQRRALHVIGPGVWTQSLAHRRKVAALCYLYKLHCIPAASPLSEMLPRPATVLPPAQRRTRLANLHHHRWQLAVDLPVRSRNSRLRSFPAGIVDTWNRLPPTVMNLLPNLAGLQAFKTRAHRHLQMSNWTATMDSL